MRVIKCDLCKKEMEEGKHLFSLETRDLGAVKSLNGLGTLSLKRELCAECHDRVRLLLASK